MADETLRWKPCRPGVGLPLGARDHRRCLRGQGSLQPLTLLPQGPLAPHRQEATLSKPLSCCWPWRPRDGFWDRFPGRMAEHHPGAPRTDLSLLTLPSPASPVLAGRPQHRRVGEAGLWTQGSDAPRQILCTSRESLVLPRGEVSAQHPKSRWGEKKKTKPNPRQWIFQPLCASPAGGFASPGASSGPTVPFPLPMVALLSPPWQLRSGASAALSSHARMG